MENDENEKKEQDKETILAKSREENKHGDEREKQTLYVAAYTATAIGFLLYGIISLVLAVLDRYSYEMNIIIFAILGTMYTIWGVKTTKRKALFMTAGILCLITTVISVVCWILNLCSVI